MATYYANYASGDDTTGDGSLGNPYKTWKKVIETAEAAGKNNTVGIIAPSGSPMVVENAGGVTLNGFTTATNYDTDFGIRIMGVDASGNPAMAYVTYVDDTTGLTALVLSTSANYIDIRGLYVNWNALSSSVLTKHFLSSQSAAANGLRVRDCVFHRGPTAYGAAINFSTLSSDDFVMTGCVFIEEGLPLSGPLLVGLDDRGQCTVQNNVFIVRGSIAGNYDALNLGSDDANLTNHNISHNTFFIVDGTVVTGSISLLTSTDPNPFALTPTKTVRSNLLYWADASVVMAFMEGNNPTDGEFEWTRNIDYNQFFYRTGNTWATGYPYNRPWNPDNASNNNVWTNENKYEGVNPFNDLGTTYAWGMTDGTYSVTLPYDLRVVTAYRALGESGTVPGAIDDLVAIPEIDASDMTVTSPVGVVLQSALRIYNVGTGDLTITNIVKAGSTKFTYTGGTAYVIGAGSHQDVTFSFYPTSAFDINVTATLTITSDDTDEGTLVVTLTGNAIQLWTPGGPLPAGPITPTSPAYFLSPNASPGDPSSGISAAIELRKNTTLEARLATTVGSGDDQSIGIVAGTVHLTTNSGLVAIPGFAVTGFNKVFVLPRGGDVTLQVGLSSFLIRDGGCFVAANTTSMTTVLMRNASPIRDVHVHFFGSKA